ncbi:MAG: iron ABC transporter permease [Myxococcota bacterium]|nr:iron ABC transporter permease [Myxococcota bacterium]
MNASVRFRVSPRRSRRFLALGGAVALCGVAFAAGAGAGALSIPPDALLSVLARELGVEAGAHTAVQASVLFAIRLPRVVLGLAIGAGLAVAGALMQGVFRNPLASPQLIGVSSGAALAAAVVLVLGAPPVLGWAGALALPIAAFAGGLAVTLLVLQLGRRHGVTNVTTLLLAGIAINALAGAGTGLLIYVADDDSLRSLTFWTLGSLAGATWPGVIVMSVLSMLGVTGACILAPSLDLLLLGEGEAHHLGVDVERTIRIAVGAAALLVGAAVALAGVIGFVGLVVPHVGRMLVGPGHRTLVPLSALLGAGLLALADVLSRTVVAPAELPLGVLTTLLGAPFFLFLLVRARRLA